MGYLRIANRYAEALLQEAQSLKALEEVKDNLTSMKTIIEQSRDFQVFLKSPIIKKEKKHQVFVATFTKSFHPLTLKFFLFLVEKERESLLPVIIESFIKLWEEASGIVNVYVRSAVELDSKQLEKMKQKFEEYTKKKVHIDVQIDKKIIGGFIASVGDTMFDASISHQLNKLHKKLVERYNAV